MHDKCKESPAHFHGPYDDIINMPHHTSEIHPRMTLEARAAQFAPFAALSGHSNAIMKTAAMHIDSFENQPADDSPYDIGSYDL